MNLPDTNVLPGPLWLITTLHVLTLSLHFAAMNFVIGGILIVLVEKWNGRGDNLVVRRFITLFPSAMAATITLGVAPLLFLQLVYPQQMYSAAIVSGWFWLLVIPGVILAYYFLYAAGFLGKDDPEAFAAAKKIFAYGMAAAAAAGLAYMATLGDYLPRLMKTPAIWALTLRIVLAAGSLHLFFKQPPPAP
jgi:hypothetical protein